MIAFDVTLGYENGLTVRLYSSLRSSVRPARATG